MERRHLIAAIMAVVAGFLLLAAGASAHKPSKRADKGKAALENPGGCVVRSLPSFVDQGVGHEEEHGEEEVVPLKFFGPGGPEEEESGNVADVVEFSCDPGPLEYDGRVKISDVQLNDRCKHTLSWSPTNEFLQTLGPATEAKLDDDRNATVVLWAGPGCKPGETEIVVDELEYPFETYVSSFTVLPDQVTTEGVFALDPCLKGGTCESKVEDDVFSSVATIIQIEVPVVETKVAINAEQLFARCGKFPHVIWVGPDEHFITEDTGRLEGPTALETDDDGNAFVVALGTRSCQPGRVGIEASLEEAESFNNYFTEFTIEAPRPTL